MGQKLSQQDLELYKRVEEVLHYIWDPIGISDEPYARSEYYTYSGIVFSLLKRSEEGKAISDYLVEVEVKQMGLGPSQEKAKRVAGILLAYKDKIFKETF